MNLLKKSLLLSLIASSFAMQAFNPEAPVHQKGASIKFTPTSVIEAIRNHPKKASLVLFLAWSIVMFETTEPTSIPVRYTLGTNFLDELEKRESFTKKIQFVMNEIRFLLMDGWVGHKGKTRSLRTYPSGKVDAQLCETLEIDPDSQQAVVVLRPGCWYKGVLGFTHNYGKPLASTMITLLGISKGIKYFGDGCNLLVENNWEL